MDYTAKVSAAYLEGFLKGVPSYLSRDEVKSILCSLQPEVSWKTYWELPDGGTRKAFILAMLWAGMYPTLNMIKNILLENKSSGPRHALLGPYKWWINEKKLQPVLLQVFEGISLDEFMAISKRTDPNKIIPLATKKQLVLLLGDKRIQGSSWYKEQIARRLRGEKLL